MSWTLDAWILCALACVLFVAFLVQIVVTRLSSLPIPLLKRHYHGIGLVTMALMILRAPDLRGYDYRDPFDDPDDHLYASSHLTLIRRFHLYLFDYALGLFTYYTYSALHQHTSKTVPRILRRLLVGGWLATVVCLLSLDVAGTMLPQRARHDPALAAEIVVACSVTFFALTQIICYLRLSSSIRGYLIERRKGLAAAADREAAANNNHINSREQDATPSQGSSFSQPQFSPRNGHRKQLPSLATQIQASPAKPHRARNNTEERGPSFIKSSGGGGTQPPVEPEADAASAAAAMALLISMGITSRRGDICFPLDAPPRVLGGISDTTNTDQQGSSPMQHHRALSDGQQEDEAENSVAPLPSEATFFGGGFNGGGGGGGADGELSARPSVSVGSGGGGAIGARGGYPLNHNLPLTGLNHSRHQQAATGRASFSTTAGAYLQTPALYATRGNSPQFDAEPSPTAQGSSGNAAAPTTPKLSEFYLPAAAQPQLGVMEQSASLHPQSERVQLVNGSPFAPSPPSARGSATRRDSHSTKRPPLLFSTHIPEDESAAHMPVEASTMVVVAPAIAGALPTALRLRTEEPTFAAAPRAGGQSSSSPRHQHTQSLIVGPSSPKGVPPSPRSRAPAVAVAIPALERKNSFGTSALLPLPQSDSPHGSFRLVAQPANAVNKLRHVLGVSAPTFSTTGAARAAETRALERRMLKIAVFFFLSLLAQSALFVGVVVHLVLDADDSAMAVDAPWIRLIESLVLACGCLLLWYSNVVNSATLKTCALAHWNWNPCDSRLPNAARRVRDMTELAFLPSNGTTMTAAGLQLRATTTHARHASRAMILDEDLVQRERSGVGGGGGGGVGGSRNYRGSMPSPHRPMRSESLFFTPGSGGAATFACPTEFATVSEMRLPAGLMPPATPDTKAQPAPPSAVQWMPALERIVTMDPDTPTAGSSGRTLRHEATTDRTTLGGAAVESDEESQMGTAREKPPPPRVTVHARIDSLEEIPCADTSFAASAAAVAAAAGHSSRSPLDIFEDAGFHRPLPMQLRDSDLAAVNTRAFGAAEPSSSEMVVAFTALPVAADSPTSASAATVPPVAAAVKLSPGKSGFRLQVQRPLAAAGSLAVPTAVVAAPVAASSATADPGSPQSGADTPGSAQRNRFQIKIRPHAASSPVAASAAATASPNTPPASETLTVIAPQPSRTHRINLRVNAPTSDGASGPSPASAATTAPVPPRDSHLEAPRPSSRASPRLVPGGFDGDVRRGSDSTNAAPAGRTSHSTSRSANGPGPGFRITVDAENPLDATDDTTTNPLSSDDYELSIGGGGGARPQQHPRGHAQHFSLEFPASPMTVVSSPSMVAAAGGAAVPPMPQDAHLLSPKSYGAHRDRESRFSFSNQTNSTLLLPPGALLDVSSGLHSSGHGLNSFRSALRAATAAGAHHLSLGVDHDGLGARSALSSPTPDPHGHRGQAEPGHYDLEKSTHVSSIHLHSHRDSHARHHRHEHSRGGSGEHSLIDSKEGEGQ